MDDAAALTNGDYPALRDGGAEIHQAAGIITVQLGVSIAEAMSRVREHAATTDQSVIDVARDVIAHRLRLAPRG